MEKAIEIKRRAQRCIQNGDLDGALAEYEKLVQAEDSDPYNFVLLADLLFKRGDNDNAVQRYLAAVSAYEKASLFKNAIAVCKKMMRLSLAPAKVLERLASLHASDGLGTEAALYYMQYAETLVRSDEPLRAADALRQAFEASPEEVKALERLAEAYTIAGEIEQAAAAMAEAAYAHAKMGRLDAAAKCRLRAEQIKAGAFTTLESQRGPITGLDRLPDGTATADEMPAEAVAGDFVTESEAGLEDVSVAVAGEESVSADPGTGGPPQHAGPPQLPTPDEAVPGDETSNPAVDVVGNGVPAVDSDLPPAILSDPDFERFPSSASAASRSVMQFDAPADVPATMKAGPVEDDAPESVNGTHASEPVPMDERPAEVVASQAPDEAVAPEAEIATDAPVGEPADQGFVHEEPAHGESVHEEPAHGESAPAIAAQTPAAALVVEETPRPTVADIEHLLSGAQERFRAGDREAAGALLVDAAVAYERIGRLDNAASIFRSLARGPQATPRLLQLWLANAEHRSDRIEAAEVACELGDRAVNDSDLEAAQGWFERACDFDPDNAIARRRLSRLAQLSADAAGVPVPFAAAGVSEPEAELLAGSVAPGAESGRVEMALGRAEAVTFDLGSLLAEFQRGIEAQLSGDAQSHYDLAMTYREMGLLDQSVDSFRLSALDPAFAYRAAEMIGRCLLEQGRFTEAAHELEEALRSPHLPAEAALGLRYQLGLAHEASGDARAALGEFERVFAAQANYSDVALKLRVLRQALESA